MNELKGFAIIVFLFLAALDTPLSKILRETGRIFSTVGTPDTHASNYNHEYQTGGMDHVPTDSIPYAEEISVLKHNSVGHISEALSIGGSAEERLNVSTFADANLGFEIPDCVVAQPQAGICRARGLKGMQSMSSRSTGDLVYISPPFQAAAPALTLLGAFLNVMDFGAKCDGSTDDTQSISAALTAAIKGGAGFYVPPSTGLCVTSTGSFLVPRNIRISCAVGSGFFLTSTTGTLFTLGTTYDSAWQHGGLDGCQLAGNGGTSTGIAMGNGTDQGQHLILDQLDIYGFWNDLVWTSQNVFGVDIINSAIHGAVCNGILLNTAAAPENPLLLHSFVFNNGNSSSTCTGIQVAAGAVADLNIIEGSIDNNGNGTLGQIYVPPTGYFQTFMSQVHMEQAYGADSTHIKCDASGVGHACQLYLENDELLMNPVGPTYSTVKPAIAIGSGILNMTNTKIQYSSIGSRLTRIIDLGNGINSNLLWATLKNVDFLCSGGTRSNGQPVGRSSAPLLWYDIEGSVVEHCSYSPLADVGSGVNTGCHDLVLNGINTVPSGTRVCSGTMTTSGLIVNGDAQFSASPRPPLSCFLPGALTSTWTGCTFTLDKPITVTRIQVQAKTAPATCATNAIVQLTDGTNPQNVAVSAAANDTGSISQDYAAAAALTVAVQTAASGCATNPGDANVIVQYRMQ